MYSSKEDQKYFIFTKLQNVLRGEARMTIDSPIISDEQKKNRMEIIEELKKYIDDYDINIELIKRAKEYNERIDDDLR